MEMRIATLSLIALLALPAAASARPPLDRSKELWATVNVCDSPARPNELGLRASMPGWATRARKQMRFRVQFFRDGEWRNITEGADSGWISLGARARATVEAGQNFKLAPPRGDELRLRGVVSFRWRRAGRTLDRARRLTEAGHTSTRGADPPDHSAAECVLG